MTDDGMPAPSGPPATFEDALGARRLVFDGPMGTPLLARGHALPVEALNHTAPQAVRELHAAYVAAGARVLRANTLLAREGEVRDPERLARLGVALAREAAPPGVWVGAPIGAPAPKPQPSSRPGRGRPAAPARPRKHVGDEQPTEEPGGNGFPRGFREAVADQARAVSEADFISLETFLLPLELETAFEAVRESWAGPVVAFCTLRSDLPTRLDAMSTQRVYGALLAFVDVASRFSPAAVGVNCVPPSALTDLAIDFLARESPFPWGILPAAAPGGLRRPIRGALPGRVSDVEIAETCVRALDRGAAFAGACCGATPETVRRIAALASAPPGTRARHRHAPAAGRRPSPQRAGFPDEPGFGERPAAGPPGERRGGFGRRGAGQRGGGQRGRQQGFGRGQGGGGPRYRGPRPFGPPQEGAAGERAGGGGYGRGPGRGPRGRHGRPGRQPSPSGEGREADGYGSGRASGGERRGGHGAPRGRPPHGRGGRPPFGPREQQGRTEQGGWNRGGPGRSGQRPRGGDGQDGRSSRGGASSTDRGHGGGEGGGERRRGGGRRPGEQGPPGGASWSGRSGRHRPASGGSWSGRARPPFGRGPRPRDEGFGGGDDRQGSGPGAQQGGPPGARRNRGRPPHGRRPDRRPDDPHGEEPGGESGAA